MTNLSQFNINIQGEKKGEKIAKFVKIPKKSLIKKNTKNEGNERQII